VVAPHHARRCLVPCPEQPLDCGRRTRGCRARPGLKASSEQNAINDALGNCVKRDGDCHVIAIGPFAVGSN